VSLALCLVCVSAAGQVYKVTDEKEGVVFTDRPESFDSNKVEKIDVPEPNSSGTPPVIPPRTVRAPGNTTEAAKPEASVTITSPEDESTIAMGPGNFSVSARVEPPLQRGESLVLMVDGQAHGAEQTGTSWYIEGALRGPHDLVVKRTGRDGTVAISDTVRVYVLRPSILRR
jgi:hypothetical protein